MKKILIATVALGLMASSAYAGKCETPKYIKKGISENDPGARVVSALFLPFTAILGGTVHVIGKTTGAGGTDKALCAVKSQWKHVVRNKE